MESSEFKEKDILILAAKIPFLAATKNYDGVMRTLKELALAIKDHRTLLDREEEIKNPDHKYKRATGRKDVIEGLR